jgi:tetratricopeptide (TPR) repeat protein
MSSSENRLDLIRKMQESDPHDPFLKYAIALEYVALNDPDSAKEQLYQLTLDSPDYLPTYYQLGKLLEATDDIDSAISIYKIGKALARQKGDQKTLGEIHEALMMWDDDEE